MTIDELEENLGADLGYLPPTFDQVFQMLRAQEEELKAAYFLAEEANRCVQMGFVNDGEGGLDLSRAVTRFRNTKGDKK